MNQGTRDPPFVVPSLNEDCPRDLSSPTAPTPGDDPGGLDPYETRTTFALFATAYHLLAETL